MSEERLLLAVLPPGSTERDVALLQNALFSARGCLSAVAIPPLIPVGFCAEELSVSRLQGAAASCAPGGRVRFKTAEWKREGGWLYLSVESGGVWDALFPAAAGPPADRPGTLFPVHPGFFMGCGEPGGQGAEAGLMAPALSFSSCALALLRLRTAGADAWWREVYMEVIRKVPLR